VGLIIIAVMLQKLFYICKMLKQLKSITLIVLVSAISTWSLAQEKKGFVGVGIGTSHILNSTKNTVVGTNLNLINAGYEIKKGFGLSFKVLSATHIISDDNKLGYQAILVGPMYTVHLSKNFLLDLKFQPGIVRVVEEIEYVATDIFLFVQGKESVVSIGISSGLSLRYNFARSWTVMLSSDYNTARSPRFLTGHERLNTILTNVGIGFRI
jgi:hypothetical protein